MEEWIKIAMEASKQKEEPKESEDDWVEEAAKTQELKNEELRLLTTDLSARLFYKPKCFDSYSGEEFTLEDMDVILMSVNHHRTDINDVRPYLRSLSTMTEEEEHEFFDLCTFKHPDGFTIDECCSSNLMLEKFRWLYERHFNVTLPKHLYIEMPKEMYKKNIN